MPDANAQIKASLNSLTNEFSAITHNLANASTVGYKRKFSQFSKELMALQGVDSKEEDRVDMNAAFDLSQGSITETGRQLDLALYGDGFFKIETPDGALYTRNGMFHVNHNGQLVDSQGRMVSGQSGAISIPSTVSLSEVNVSSDGSVSDGKVSIDRLTIVDFKDDKNKLIPAGMNCFSVPDEIEGKEAENVIVKQGYLESSNVKVVEELVNMITVSRLYEANMKFLAKKSENGESIMGVAMAV